MAHDVGVGQVVAGEHRHACGLEHPAIVHLVASSRHVLGVNQLLGLDQGVVERRAHHDHHIVRAGVNVLVLHLHQGVGEGGVQLGRVLCISQSCQRGAGAAEVAEWLACRTRLERGLSEAGSLECLDQASLILELGDFLALLGSNFAASIHLRLEHVQHREELAGSDGGVHRHLVLRKVGLDAVQCNAWYDLLQDGLAYCVVGKGSRTLHLTHRDLVSEDGLTVDGAFHHASELLDNEGQLVGLGGVNAVPCVGEGDVCAIQRHECSFR